MVQESQIDGKPRFHGVIHTLSFKRVFLETTFFIWLKDLKKDLKALKFIGHVQHMCGYGR